VIAAHLLWPPKTTMERVPITSAEVAEYSYIASVNSEVFHRPACKWAKKIYPRNLVGFKTREDAINSGRSPCKVCKP
jgi:methylphosphotriester-DNA--protein-cysteine methyltransferase